MPLPKNARHLHWLLTLVVFLLLSIGSGCTIQKRIHRKGWHVEWRSVKNSKDNIRNTQESKKNQRGFNVDNTEKPPAKANSEEIVLESTSSNAASCNLQQDGNLEESTQKKPSLQRTQESNSRNVRIENESERKIPHEPMSPPKPPLTAYILLIIGAILVGGGLILLLVFAIINSTLIGLPSPITVMILVGIAFLILAYRSAVNAEQKEKQWTPPVKEQPKEEKKERKPLKRGDKIFLAIIGALIAVIGVALIVY